MNGIHRQFPGSYSRMEGMEGSLQRAQPSANTPEAWYGCVAPAAAQKDTDRLRVVFLHPPARSLLSPHTTADRARTLSSIAASAASHFHAASSLAPLDGSRQGTRGADVPGGLPKCSAVRLGVPGDVEWLCGRSARVTKGTVRRRGRRRHGGGGGGGGGVVAGCALGGLPGELVHGRATRRAKEPPGEWRRREGRASGRRGWGGGGVGKE